MRTFFQRNAYLLVLFVPTAIYVLSYSLFEINAQSSLDIKQHIIDTIKKHQESPVSEILEFQLRILWIGSGLLLIVTYISSLAWCATIISRCYSGIHIAKLAIVGLPILALALIQICYVNPQSAMYNNIFDTTYQSLAASSLNHEEDIKKVYNIILFINILADIAPVFIMFAICSSISWLIGQGTQKLEFYIKRMEYLKQGIMIGSAVLLSGIIHMFAWMQLPIAMVGEGERALKNRILDLASSTCQYWGVVATLSLLFLYASAAIYWQARTQEALTEMQPDFDIPQWMEENGIAFSWKKDALHVGGMLAPTIISALSHALSAD